VQLILFEDEIKVLKTLSKK